MGRTQGHRENMRVYHADGNNNHPQSLCTETEGECITYLVCETLVTVQGNSPKQGAQESRLKNQRKSMRKMRRWRGGGGRGWKVWERGERSGVKDMKEKGRDKETTEGTRRDTCDVTTPKNNHKRLCEESSNANQFINTVNLHCAPVHIIGVESLRYLYPRLLALYSGLPAV
ncbi:hypothetical protein E4T56_gene18269 [Termitomyces sp. T112]|nr:hypothetical protein E4T56_gene18269 [Termitomyces sp. T112]